MLIQVIAHQILLPHLILQTRKVRVKMKKIIMTLHLVTLIRNNKVIKNLEIHQMILTMIKIPIVKTNQANQMINRTMMKLLIRKNKNWINWEKNKKNRKRVLVLNNRKIIRKKMTMEMYKEKNSKLI